MAVTVTIIMYILYISSCSSIESYEFNTTTLYPVNRTFDLKQQGSNNVYNNKQIQKEQESNKQSEINNKSDNFLIQDNDNIKLHESKNSDREQKSNETGENEDIITDSQIKDGGEEMSGDKHEAVGKGVKNEVTTWSVETNYSQADEKENEKEEPKKIMKEFRPSPHLGSFYDEDAFALTTQASVIPWSPFTKSPGFIRSPQNFYKLNYKKPIDAPYKFETTFLDPTYWKHHTGLESRPTDTVPVKTPAYAGGLYKTPEVNKEHAFSQEYGLSYKEESKGASHKKGVSPWKSFLQLATALLPVGLIVSALTPNVVSLQTTDNSPYNVNRITRRVEGFKRLPQISEGCKRRLLCELHAGHHSHQTSSGHKHCYKLECDDPVAMTTVLRFILTHPPPGSSPPGGTRPFAPVIPLG